MDSTSIITKRQWAIRFVPANLRARLKRKVHFFSRVSTDCQDHRKYRAALEAAHNLLNLPKPFNCHDLKGCCTLDGNGKVFVDFANIIRNMDDVICVFPALDRLFRPVGFSQYDPATWDYQESDFELFRQKLIDVGLNPDKITFALLNDGLLETDRAFENRLAKNLKGTRLDSKTIYRLKKEVRKLGELGMTAADIYFHMAVRLEPIADRTIRDWYNKMGLSLKRHEAQQEAKEEARALAIVDSKNAAEIRRHFQSKGVESEGVRSIQKLLQDSGCPAKRGRPKSTELF